MKEKEMEKKAHWTQTPEGKRRMARAQKKSWRTRRSKSKAETIVKSSEPMKMGRQMSPSTSQGFTFARVAFCVIGSVFVSLVTMN